MSFPRPIRRSIAEGPGFREKAESLFGGAEQAEEVLDALFYSLSQNVYRGNFPVAHVSSHMTEVYSLTSNDTDAHRSHTILFSLEWDQNQDHDVIICLWEVDWTNP
jgi:hypothetical protein